MSITGDLEGSGVGLGRDGSREWGRGGIAPSPAGGRPILGRREEELQVQLSVMLLGVRRVEGFILMVPPLWLSRGRVLSGAEA